MTSRADLFFIQYYQTLLLSRLKKGSHLWVTLYQNQTWLKIIDYNSRNRLDPIQSLTIYMLSDAHWHFPLFEILIATLCNEMPVGFILPRPERLAIESRISVQSYVLIDH